jgi:hypothetical protein
MIIQMDEVLWEFSKRYREKFLAEHPDVELSELSPAMAVIALLRAMAVTGDVIQNIHPDGNVTWNASPKFLGRTGIEAGRLVTLRCTLN